MDGDKRRKIDVYQYLYWNDATKAQEVSRVYAPLDVIKNGLGMAILASGIQIQTWELMASGVYDPAKNSE